MELKIFENEKIPEEIEKFYDDLAKVYLNSDYNFGIKEKGIIDSEKLGRYKLSQLDITLVSPNTDINFLIYSTDGHKKQDEIVMLYDKYILLNEIKSVVENYLNEVVDLSNFEYTDGKNKFKKPNDNSDKYINTMKVSLAGLIIACHKFNIRTVLKLFKERIIYIDENKIPVTWYIDDKDYDLSFLVEDLYELVYPDYDAKKDDLEIDESKEFIGNKTNDIIAEMKKTEKKESKFLKMLENIGGKILDTGSEIAKKYLIELIKSEFNNEKSNKKKSTQNKEEKIEKIEKTKERIGKKINEKIKKIEDKKNYRIDKNKKNMEKLNNKFLNDYGLENLAKYFLDVTNRKLRKNDEKAFNEILKSDNELNNGVVNQDNIKKYKSIDRKEISAIEYIYNTASESKKPLESIEKSLKYISARYENSTVKDTVNIIKDSIYDKVKEYYTDKINEYTNDNLKKNKNMVLSSLGLVDVDDINIDINTRKLEKIKETSEYKLVNLVKNQNLVAESFSTINNHRKYPKTRRLLDNIQINIVKALCNIKNENFDGVINNDKNIFCNYIIYLDQVVNGLSDYEYNMFYNIEKNANITGLIIYLVKSKYSFRDESFIFLSTKLKNLKYQKYVKKDTLNLDKTRIKKIFPTYSSLEYNFNLRNAMNICFFYKELYNDNKEIKTYYVCDGAIISCKFSNSTSTIICKDTSKYIEGKNIATIENKKIIPFSNCSISQDHICKPNLRNWEKTINDKIDNKYVLMSNSVNFCSLGGLINIIDANQNKSGFSNLDKNNNQKMYYTNDYVAIDSKFISEFVDLFLNKEDIKIYNNIKNINLMEESIYNYLKIKFKAKNDEYNLENAEIIPAVNPYEKKIINIFPLKKYVKGYYIGKLKNKNIKIDDNIIYEGVKMSNLLSVIFLKKVFDRLDILYMPYDVIDNKNEKKTYWMKKVLAELEINKLNKNVKNSNVNWNVFFINYIMNTDINDISVYLEKDIDRYYNKINEIIYGSIILLKNELGEYSIGFLVSKVKTGFYVIGVDKNGKIKKIFYKNSNLVSLFWPK